MPRPKRQPLKAVKNGSRAKTEAASKPVVSAALKGAIYSVDDVRLRQWIVDKCESIEPLRKCLEESFLVLGKEVVRYHVDCNLEDDEKSENDGSEKDEEDDNGIDEDGEPSKKIKPIAVADDKMTPRYASCLNCKDEFDVTINEKGDCIWHSGNKEVNYDCDFWDDHDEDCHGRCDSLIDEPDYAGGFIWTCCDREGDDEGCKSTKHKAEVNLVRYPPPTVITVPAAASRKRKAENDLARSSARRQ